MTAPVPGPSRERGAPVPGPPVRFDVWDLAGQRRRFRRRPGDLCRRVPPSLRRSGLPQPSPPPPFAPLPRVLQRARAAWGGASAGDRVGDLGTARARWSRDEGACGRPRWARGPCSGTRFRRSRRFPASDVLRPASDAPLHEFVVSSLRFISVMVRLEVTGAVVSVATPRHKRVYVFRAVAGAAARLLALLCAGWRCCSGPYGFEAGHSHALFFDALVVFNVGICFKCRYLTARRVWL